MLALRRASNPSSTEFLKHIHRATFPSRLVVLQQTRSKYKKPIRPKLAPKVEREPPLDTTLGGSGYETIARILQPLTTHPRDKHQPAEKESPGTVAELAIARHDMLCKDLAAMAVYTAASWHRGIDGTERCSAAAVIPPLGYPSQKFPTTAQVRSQVVESTSGGDPRGNLLSGELLGLVLGLEMAAELATERPIRVGRQHWKIRVFVKHRENFFERLERSDREQEQYVEAVERVATALYAMPLGGKEVAVYWMPENTNIEGHTLAEAEARRVLHPWRAVAAERGPVKSYCR